jgi:SAM-dependent methyltransferase/Tfp pilus assembly protein PilF
MSAAVGPAELAVREALRAAMAHHDAGRLREAEAGYREVLASAPGRPDALALLATLEQATGRLDDALAHVDEALRTSADAAGLHNVHGLVLEARGRTREAEAAYRKACALAPRFAPALFNLGNLLRVQARGEEAIACYRRALDAQPRYAAAWNNLGVALQDAGRLDEALAAYRTALGQADLPECRTNFARCAAMAPRIPSDAGFRALVARAIAEAWIRPADLARTAATLLSADGAIRPDGLLVALLSHAQVCDAALERRLTEARRALLESALDAAGGERLDLACALARQGFLNDYVFAVGEDEARRLRALRERIEAALASGQAVAPLPLAVLAAYVSLGALAGAEALAARPWPDGLAQVVAQQIVEPREERELRARIPSLAPVRSEVSRAVRRQYEESPYPRWVACAPVAPSALEAHQRELRPGAAPGAIARDAPREILVAGCGTGQESTEIARRFPRARVLAIDLSLASLAFARRKSEALGVANVEYAHADIAELDDLGGRRFDLVSSVGVLHHLGDPVAGAQRLAALLAPGGFMQVGLYSETARRDIVRARDFIARRGFAPTPEGIRAAREALRAEPEFAAVASLRDFFGIHECRDLLFHVQEHRYTLEGIATLVAALGLEWIGLAVDPATRRRHAERFPDAAARHDPATWAAFEREFPDTFAGMYLFWLRKPAEG